MLAFQMSRFAKDAETRAEGFRSAFRKPLKFPRRLFSLLSVLILFFVAALVGRAGTDAARLLGAGFFLLGGVLLILRARLWRRLWADPHRSLRRSLAALDEDQADRAVRAYRLAKSFDSSDTGGSARTESRELAELHATRVFDGVSLDKVTSRALVVRRRGLWLSFLMSAVCFWLLAFRALLVVEGVDVLLARGGVGPFALSYVEQLQVTAELPAYLDGTGQKRLVSSRLTAVPQGSEIEVRIIPRVVGRKLLLTDGVSEAAFVSDGQGGLIARWVAEDPSKLRVAARFGDVLLLDHLETQLAPLTDRGPSVFLRGAPREVALDTLESLKLEFTAADDHGLAEIDVVLRSGQRTLREELVHLDGQRRVYEGAHVLTREHDFLKKAFLPVRVVIEARDGNTAAGPSWGKSQPITLLPPPLGHEVAARHRALRAFRGVLVDYLASEVTSARLSGLLAKETRSASALALTAGFERLSGELSGMSQAPQRSLQFLKAQVEALSRKGSERASAEAVLLACDVLIENIAVTEAQSLARDLGAAVEEVAILSRELHLNSEGLSREGLEDLVEGTRRGAERLSEVGRLGLDLGSVALSDLGRIKSKLRVQDFPGAEAAAHHLAERLKRATPSFGSKGGAAEAGLPRGQNSSGSAQSGDSSAMSEAPGAFERLSEALDQLAQDNAQDLHDLERLMREAARAAKEDFEPTDALEKATSDLRRALNQLPESAEGTVGVRAEAANARSEGESMADALGAGDLVEAIERGALAQESLRRADEMAGSRPGWVDEKALKDAQDALKRAMDEARRLSRKNLNEQGSQIEEGLSKAAQAKDELARRARELQERGRQSDSPLPEQSLNALKRAHQLLKEAAQSLRQGNAHKAVERSREAQQALEEAMPQAETGESEGSADDWTDGSGEQSPKNGHVPQEGGDLARDFRERVERGLGRESGRLSPAVRRYAEELK